MPIKDHPTIPEHNEADAKLHMAEASKNAKPAPAKSAAAPSTSAAKTKS